MIKKKKKKKSDKGGFHAVCHRGFCIENGISPEVEDEISNQFQTDKGSLHSTAWINCNCQNVLQFTTASCVVSTFWECSLRQLQLAEACKCKIIWKLAISLTKQHQNIQCVFTDIRNWNARSHCFTTVWQYWTPFFWCFFFFAGFNQCYSCVQQKYSMYV